MSATAAMHVSPLNPLQVSGTGTIDQRKDTSPTKAPSEIIDTTPTQSAASGSTVGISSQNNCDGRRLPDLILSTARMTRKRVADLAVLEHSSQEAKEESQPTPSFYKFKYGTDICLCQPDPKIPRPRNAFILYRQNHHQEIVGQHPGLPNPQISKIAGQLWAGEPDEVKLEWKRLAEQEKARHAQQYPDYRFQPRHKFKGAAADISSPTSAKRLRCNKCGGQSIAGTGPLTTSSPGTSQFPVSTSNPDSADILSPATRNLPSLKQLTLNSPQAAAPSPGMTPFPPLGSPPEMSDAKRRRMNAYPPTSLSGSMRSREESGARPMSSGDLTGSFHSYQPPNTPGARRESLPPPTPSTHPNRAGNLPLPPPQASPSGTMGPPPSRSMANMHHGLHSNPQTPRLQYPGHTHDSLRLPPLQPSTDQGRTVHSVIMSMPFLGKIRLLRTVAQPIKFPGSTSPMHRNRGAIIAIEGDKDSPIDVVLDGLEEALKRTGEFDIKVIHGPTIPLVKADFGSYIAEIARWHSTAVEIQEFVTGMTASEFSAQAKSHRRQPSIAKDDGNRMEVDKAECEGEQNSQDNPQQQDRRDSTLSNHSHTSASKYSDHSSLFSSSDSSLPSPMTKIPILIVPQYLVRASDAWAAALPINDAYSPTDHWQWVATLWRGVPGADFTIYVRNGAEPMPNSGDDGQSPAHPMVGDPWSNKSHVEIREELRTIVVRRDKGRVDDSAIRRVAFEVGEWARSGSKS